MRCACQARWRASSRSEGAGADRSSVPTRVLARTPAGSGRRRQRALAGCIRVVIATANHDGFRVHSAVASLRLTARCVTTWSGGCWVGSVSWSVADRRRFSRHWGNRRTTPIPGCSLLGFGPLLVGGHSGNVQAIDEISSSVSAEPRGDAWMCCGRHCQSIPLGPTGVRPLTNGCPHGPAQGGLDQLRATGDREVDARGTAEGGGIVGDKSIYPCPFWPRLDPIVKKSWGQRGPAHQLVMGSLSTSESLPASRTTGPDRRVGTAPTSGGTHHTPPPPQPVSGPYGRAGRPCQSPGRLLDPMGMWRERSPGSASPRSRCWM